MMKRISQATSAGSRLIRTQKSWICTGSGCKNHLFDSLGSFAEHFHRVHGISDFKLMAKHLTLFERRFQVDTGRFGTLDCGEKIILDDDLSEIINYHETVANNAIGKLAQFRASFTKRKGNNERTTTRVGRPVLLQNLTGALCQQPGSYNDLFRSQKQLNTNNKTFKQRQNLPSIEEIKDNGEAVDRDTLDEASEESRLTVDKMNAANKSPSSRRHNLATSNFGLRLLGSVVLEKRSSLDSQVIAPSDHPSKKVKNRLESSLQHNGSTPARFSNSISLGNLAFK